MFKTNVWRLFQTLDLTDASKQVAYYDNGVGTSSFKLFAVLGGIFGFGLKRNVIDIYSFCCRNYVDGDRIFGFGFSRGAFTMRVVAGLIAREGLVPYNGDEIALARYAASAYRDYRRRFNSTEGLVNPLRSLRDFVIRAYRRLAGIPQYDKALQIPIEQIDFLGLWDTVDAYGGPIEEITRAIDYWYWPLSMPDRFMNAKVHRACHALALEDERDAFGRSSGTKDTSATRRPASSTTSMPDGRPMFPANGRTSSRPSTTNDSARSGSWACTRTSEADIRRMDYPT